MWTKLNSNRDSNSNHSLCPKWHHIPLQCTTFDHGPWSKWKHYKRNRMPIATQMKGYLKFWRVVIHLEIMMSWQTIRLIQRSQCTGTGIWNLFKIIYCLVIPSRSLHEKSKDDWAPWFNLMSASCVPMKWYFISSWKPLTDWTHLPWCICPPPSPLFYPCSNHLVPPPYPLWYFSLFVISQGAEKHADPSLGVLFSQQQQQLPPLPTL